MKRWAIVILLFAAAGAAADMRVAFRIDSAAMQSRYSKGLPDLQNEVASSIVPMLRECLPQWRYVTSGTTAGVLQFSVDSDRTTQEHWFDLTVTSAAGVVYSAEKVVWLKPGDFFKQIGSYPSRIEAPQKLAAAVRKHLLTQQTRQELFRAMQKQVPIAITSQWVDTVGRQEERRIVAPVRWEDAQALGASTFRVVCNWPRENARVELYSEVTMRPATYSDAQTRQKYEALTLRPVTRRYLNEEQKVGKVKSNEMLELEPRAIFLEDFRGAQ
jgi:hypothetical protein